MTESWSIGIDVGGKRKGFHLAMMRDSELFVEQGPLLDPESVLKAISRKASVPDEIGVVAIDSPQNWAPENSKHRACERKYRSLGLSGIFFTPDSSRAKANTSGFYEWIENGMGLYNAMKHPSVGRTIEVFPTASWSKWCGSRPKKMSRAKWTKAGIISLEQHFGLEISGQARNQDQRDAVAAALTALLYSREETETVSDGDSRHDSSLEAGIVIPRESL